jgi:CheY-like chemotaxis protein
MMRAKSGEAVILVVDDDANTGRCVARYFGEGGEHVTIAGSGRAARALGGNFDVGVFEIELDGINGIELAQKLLDEGRLGRVVFFSGATWQGLLRRAAALGPVVPKNAGPAVLASVLRRLVRSPFDSGADGHALASA